MSDFKIRILNPHKGRNVHTFELFNRVAVQRVFNDFGIRFVDRQPDFLFVGMADFMDKDSSLAESIEFGIQTINRLSDPVFLFDGSDSTALLGSYDVFAYTPAWYLFKPSLLYFEDYLAPSAFNNWFFGTGSELDCSYRVDADLASRMKLTGWNLGFYRGYQYPSLFLDHSIDVSGIFRTNPKGRNENFEHRRRNDRFYRQHRTNCQLAIECLAPRRRVLASCLGEIETNLAIRQSRISVSPFGMGEICYRDFEIGLSGAALMKPSMSRVRTIPDIYIDGRTYCQVAPDFSDLAEKVDVLLSGNGRIAESLSEGFRSEFLVRYDYARLAEHWRAILEAATPRYTAADPAPP